MILRPVSFPPLCWKCSFLLSPSSPMPRFATSALTVERRNHEAQART